MPWTFLEAELFEINPTGGKGGREVASVGGDATTGGDPNPAIDSIIALNGVWPAGHRAPVRFSVHGEHEWYSLE